MAVARPRGVRRAARDPPLPRAVGAHEPEVEIAHEGDAATVRRRCRLPVVARVACQLGDAAAVRGRRVDLAVAVAVAREEDRPGSGGVGRRRARRVEGSCACRQSHERRAATTEALLVTRPTQVPLCKGAAIAAFALPAAPARNRTLTPAA
jgi:hypothetical protein